MTTDVLPTRTLERLIFERVEYLLKRPDSEVAAGRGLSRSTHVAAFIERTYTVYMSNDRHDGSPGFFSTEIRERISHRLATARLGKEESRFRDILEWRGVDKAALRKELRSNLLRILREDPQPYGPVGLELHVLFDMRMRYNAPGYESAIEPEDERAHPHLRLARERCARLVPELFAA